MFERFGIGAWPAGRCRRLFRGAGWRGFPGDDDLAGPFDDGDAVGAPHQRPAACFLHRRPGAHHAAPAAFIERIAPGCRRQHGTQAGVAVGIDQARGHQFAQRGFQFRTEQTGVARQFVEEHRAFAAQRSQHPRGAGRYRDLASHRRQCVPQRQLTPGQQHQRRAAHRAAGRGTGRAHAGPDDFAGAAQVVEPGVRIVCHAQGQQVAFPAAGGRLVAFELRQDLRQCVLTTELVTFGQVLPVEQETHEVLALDRLDLAPQPLDGVAVDARQQVAFHPFLVLRTGREAAAHHVAFALQPGEGDGRCRCIQTQRSGDGGDGLRAEAAQARAQQFHQRAVAGPGFVVKVGR